MGQPIPRRGRPGGRVAARSRLGTGRGGGAHRQGGPSQAVAEPNWLSGTPKRWIGGRGAPARPKATSVPGRRVIRSVDTWTVFRVSFLFYVCVLLVLLIAGSLLWLVASTFGIVHNVEKFIGKLFDLNSFRFQAWSILLGSTLGGMVVVLLGTGANVLAALLYNLISDVVGGVEITVLEDPPAQPAAEVRPLTASEPASHVAPVAPLAGPATPPVPPAELPPAGERSGERW